MRKFLSASCLGLAILAIGCSASTEPVPVTTSEDEMAAYEQSIAGEEEEAQKELEAEDGP